MQIRDSMAYDEDKSIRISDKYDKLPFFEVYPHRFFNQTTIIYGAPKTGKSTIIDAILYALRKNIPGIVVISPTDSTNSAYSKRVPPGCVHSQITKELLEKIITRQRKNMKIHEITNNLEYLTALFAKINVDKKLKILEQDLIRVANEHIIKTRQSSAEFPIVKSTIESIKHACEDKLRHIYKLGIRNGAKFESELNKREKCIVRYLDHNPYLFLIMDDCASQLRKLSKAPELLELFTTVRWLGLTIVIAAHNDTNLDPQIRNNSFNSIFTDEESVGVFFGRSTGTSGLTKEKKNKARDIASILFREEGGGRNHKKLVFTKERLKTGDSKWSQFHYAYVNLHDNFIVGSPHLWNLCETSADKEAESLLFDQLKIV